MTNSTEHARSCQLVRPAPVLILAVATACLGLTGCNTLRPEEPAAFDSSTTENVAEQQDAAFKYCPIETVRQPSSKASGLAALTSVMKYWEQEVDVATLEEKYPAKSEGGYPLLQLRRIATKEGLIAFALTMKDRPLEQVSEQLENGRPIIVPVVLSNGRDSGSELPVVSQPDSTTDNSDMQPAGSSVKYHYVVIFGQSRDKFLLMDPAQGIVKVSKSEFTGYSGRGKIRGTPLLLVLAR